MDERTLPPGSLDAALEAMRAALGAENVLTDPEGMADHGDPFAPPAFIQGGKMRSATGVFGDPTRATAENGRAYFGAKVADLLRFLEDFIALDV